MPQKVKRKTGFKTMLVGLNQKAVTTCWQPARPKANNYSRKTAFFDVA